MTGGINGLIQHSYYTEIVNKTQIHNYFKTKSNPISQISHINMICLIVLQQKDNLDKSQLIHAMEEINNSIKLINE
jgi:hypothetical protein